MRENSKAFEVAVNTGLFYNVITTHVNCDLDICDKPVYPWISESSVRIYYADPRSKCKGGPEDRSIGLRNWMMEGSRKAGNSGFLTDGGW